MGTVDFSGLLTIALPLVLIVVVVLAVLRRRR